MSGPDRQDWPRTADAAVGVAVIIVLVTGAVFAAALAPIVPSVRLLSGSSMEPTISTPAIVVCDTSVDTATELHPGDIAAFHIDGEVYLHRYLGPSEQPGLHRFRGDNNPNEIEQVPTAAVICRHQFHIGRGGTIPAAALSVLLAGSGIYGLRHRVAASG